MEWTDMIDKSEAAAGRSHAIHVSLTVRSQYIPNGKWMISVLYFKQNYHFQHIPEGGGGGVQMLISIETHITYDFPGGGGSGLPTPSGSAHGETVRVHMPILSLRCLQMRQYTGRG